MKPGHDSLPIRIVRAFLGSNLSLILILLSITVGIVALMVTPREEEPQIVIPVADILVSFPGHSAREVEQLVSAHLEKYLFQIDGVEYVYSRSLPGKSIVTVRFFVGQDREKSLVKLRKWLDQNSDRIPAGVSGFVVKPVETDDVPIATLTFTSPGEDDYSLRRIAEEVLDRLQSVANTGITSIVGGRPRQLLVRPDPEAMAAFHVTPLDISRALQGADANFQAGAFSRADQDVRVEAGRFLSGKQDVESLVVGVSADKSSAGGISNDRPVYLKDVAKVTDGPGEVTSYVRFSAGPAWSHRKEAGAAGQWIGADNADPGKPPVSQPAVTIAIAKQKGANNVRVAEDILARMETIRKEVVPDDVSIAITRNYGITANDKVNELVEGLAVGVIVVIALLTMGLGFTESLVVAVAVPCVFGLTLAVNYLFGFSINRVTLFALTVSLGLLVDDPIVDVENIHRHFEMMGSATRDIVLEAVNEVRPPLIAATIAVIISFLPLFFVTEEMHDYMRPMAVNVPVTMFMSMFVSFTITPWLAYHALKGRYAKKRNQAESVPAPHEPADITQTRLYRIFRPLQEPLLKSRLLSCGFLFVIFLAFIASLSLVATRRVQPKQLPFDNKDELLLVIDMPSGTTLERTDGVVRDFEDYLQTVPEATDFEAYVGTHSPVDFNGLSRKYFLREFPNRADIRVNLIHKTERLAASHEIALRLRGDLTAIAGRSGAKLKIVELPAGPPVMSTVVAAVYGQPGQSYNDLIAASRIVKARMLREPGVVDVDDTVEEDQVKEVFTIDKEKAALNGITTEDISRTILMCLEGVPVGTLAVPDEKNPLQIIIWLPRAQRSNTFDLSRVYVKGVRGNLVPIAELGRWQTTMEDKTIYHRDLEPVVYVTAEMAGRPPVETIMDIRADNTPPAKMHPAGTGVSDANARPLKERTLMKKGGGVLWAIPESIRVQWWDEGEMRLTIHIFRDLGVGFLGALLGIYILLVYQTGSFGLPLVIMLAIPLMVIGVMPGYWLLNHVGLRMVGQFPNPMFFSSPAMIGMIALSGIVARNSIIIIDFIHLSLSRGKALIPAIVESCAVRLRPILLTSGAAMLGAFPITMDTVFAGLAWSLIFGLFASTLFSLFVIPVAYNLIYAKKPGFGLPEHLREATHAESGGQV
ncbi:MAG: efflux RND transporter permease subunit [Deltaproteobacteria bacterium]|nr:efflux RND transporter permease subunit [Deltaproteobacteria bacterium]